MYFMDNPQDTTRFSARQDFCVCCVASWQGDRRANHVVINEVELGPASLSSVNPQTILSQKTFCIINQTWYWVTWILFTPARPRSWPRLQPWHWSRCRKMALGSDSWQTDRLIESAEKNWRKFSRAAAAPVGISAAKYFHDSIEIFLRFITVSMSGRRVASWNNY